MSSLDLVGVEDGGFKAFQPGQSTFLCAVSMVGNSIESIELSRITVDGRDATEVLLGMLDTIRCDAVILGGVSFAGFNIMDPMRLYKELGVPVIIYSGERPDSASVLAALKVHFADWEVRWASIARLGDIYSLITKVGYKPVFFEVVGESRDWCEKVLRSSASLTRAPEPIRVARILARGLTKTV
ncbi:MAG: DUF99 family protein [Candidatus Bathyarchaeia archaeon]